MQEVLFVFRPCLLFVLSLLFHPLLAQEGFVFHNTKGKEHHQSDKDFRIVCADHQMVNNALQMVIEVEDDEIRLSKDDLNSDHLEVWFSMSEETSMLYKIAHPVNDNDWFGYEPPHFRDETDDFDESLIEDFVTRTYLYDWDNIDSSIYGSKVHSRIDFMGTTHWGIFKDTALLFDLEQYVDFPYREPNHRPEVHITPTEKGYTYTVRFNVENLLFLQALELNRLRCNLVLFDYDDEGTALHTTSKRYEWGKVDDFITLNFQEAFQPKIAAAYVDYEDYREGSGGFYYFDNEQWRRYRIHYDPVDWWDNFEFLDYVEMRVKRVPIQFGETAAFLYTSPTVLYYFPPTNEAQEKVFIKDGDVVEDEYLDYPDFKAGDTLSFLRFNDGSIGFTTYNSHMNNPYGRGMCGSCRHYYYSFYRVSNGQPHEILGIYFYDGDMTGAWGVEGINGDYDPHWFDLEWNEALNQMVIEADEMMENGDSKRFRIGWDKDWQPYLVKNEE